MKDIIIENNQFKIVGGSFVYTQGTLEYVSQAIAEILQTVIGEDPQDSTKGLDLQGVMFNSKSSSSDIYGEVLRNVQKVPGVTVEDIEISQVQEDLKITVKYIYDGQQAEVTTSVEN